MAVLIGQGGDNEYQASLSLNYSSIAGNTLVACVQHMAVTTSPTITDSAGNTWVVAGTTIGNVEAQAEMLSTMYYCLNASAISSISIPAGSMMTVLSLSEWSGIESLRNVNSNSDQYPTSLQVTVNSVAGDLVLASCSNWPQDVDASATPDAGWDTLTARGSGSNWMAVAYDLASPGGVIGPTFSNPTGAGKFGNITASFVTDSSTPDHAPYRIVEWDGVAETDLSLVEWDGTTATEVTVDENTV